MTYPVIQGRGATEHAADRRAYWKQRFLDDGREAGWEQAMARFRDKTGRPGPATWELGRYPEGLGDYPVGGVSW